MLIRMQSFESFHISTFKIRNNWFLADYKFVHIFKNKYEIHFEKIKLKYTIFELIQVNNFLIFKSKNTFISKNKYI